MDNDKMVGIDDILRIHIKDNDLKWEGASCTYKGIEIMSVFDSVIWVRSSMPDHRDKHWLQPENPDFFKRFDDAVKVAKEVVDETIETEAAMNAMRQHVFGSKPALDER